MAIPSIAMIPSGYKQNKVYSVLPTDGSGDLDFARTSTGTRVNSSSLIEEIGTGKPRLDYSDGSCPSLLLELSSTNLITQSELFSNSYWTKSGATVTSGFASPSVDSPSGAFKLVEDTSNGAHRAYKTDLANGAAASSAFTYSIIAKDSDRDFILLKAVINGQSVTVNVWFDLANGVVGTQTNGTGKIESLSNGFYRCSATFSTNSSATSLNVYTYLADLDNSENYQGDGTSGVSIFGAQLEQNSSATSYIPTAGTAITRTADSAYLGNLNTKGLINDSAIVLYLENDIQSNTVNQYKQFVSLYNDAFDTGLRLETRIDNRVYIQQSGLVTSGDDFNSLSLGTDSVDFKKIAVYLTTTQFKVFADGAQVGTTLNGAYVLDFDNVGFSEYNQNVEAIINSRDLRIYKTALSDSELTTLTTL